MSLRHAKNMPSHSSYKCNAIWVVTGATAASFNVRLDDGSTCALYVPGAANVQGGGYHIPLGIVGVATLPAGVTLMGMR